MTLKLTIAMDNAAFEPDPYAEAARILRETADSLEEYLTGFCVHDVNGNRVGTLTITGTRKAV